MYIMTVKTRNEIDLACARNIHVDNDNREDFFNICSLLNTRCTERHHACSSEARLIKKFLNL